jgi:hypothetical protein
MSSLKKQTDGYHWPIHNSNIARNTGPLDGPIKIGRLILRKMDLFWSSEDEAKVIEMWASGNHIADIAEAINRDQDEIAILVIELAREEKISYRDAGVYGSEVKQCK